MAKVIEQADVNVGVFRFRNFELYYKSLSTFLRA